MQFFRCRWCNTVLSRNMQSQVHSVNSRFMRSQRLTLWWITVKHGGFKKNCSLLLWNSVRAFCSHRVPFRSHRKCTNPQNLAAMDWQSIMRSPKSYFCECGQRKGWADSAERVEARLMLFFSFKGLKRVYLVHSLISSQKVLLSQQWYRLWAATEFKI